MLGNLLKMYKSNKTDDEIVADAIKSFAAALGKTVDEIPKPVATMCTRWYSDPYSLGAYSYLVRCLFVFWDEYIQFLVFCFSQCNSFLYVKQTYIRLTKLR